MSRNRRLFSLRRENSVLSETDRCCVEVERLDGRQRRDDARPPIHVVGRRWTQSRVRGTVLASWASGRAGYGRIVRVIYCEETVMACSEAQRSSSRRSANDKTAGTADAALPALPVAAGMRQPAARREAGCGHRRP